MALNYDPSFAKAVTTVIKPKSEIVYCKGMSDCVRLPNLTIFAHVGMHEIDNKPTNIKQLVQNLADELETTIAVFETRKGYHFVSFECMDDVKYLKWLTLMKQNLPNPAYPAPVCDHCSNLMEEVFENETNDLVWICPNCGKSEQSVIRVLRISVKGPDSPPKFSFWGVAKTNGKIPKYSAIHVKIYRENLKLPEFPNKNFDVIHTSSDLIDYETRAGKNVPTITQ